MELKDQIVQLGKDIDAKLEKANEQARLAGDSAAKAIAEDLKTEVKNMTSKWKELHDEQVKRNEKQQEQIDALETKMKRPGGTASGPAAFDKDLEKSLEGIADKLKAKKSQSKGLDVSFDFEQKAVSDMLTTDVGRLTGAVIEPFRRAGVIETPYRFNHVRDVMTAYPTNSPIIYYLQENGGEGSPGMVAEGALKPQIDYDLIQKTDTVKKIAAHLRLSEEMIEDIPFIVNYVTTRGREDLLVVEDQQLLYGDGTGNNLTGVTIGASQFAAGTTIIASATEADILRVAMRQLRIGRYMATAIMLNPFDVAALELRKDSQGNYLFRSVGEAGLTSIWGLPIVESDAIVAGSFLVGDFRRGAEIYDRKALNVRMYDQDRDNPIRNMVTIVIEERLALANVRPAAFVKGTFAAAVTDLAS